MDDETAKTAAGNNQEQLGTSCSAPGNAGSNLPRCTASCQDLPPVCPRVSGKTGTCIASVSDSSHAKEQVCSAATHTGLPVVQGPPVRPPLRDEASQPTACRGGSEGAQYFPGGFAGGVPVGTYSPAVHYYGVQGSPCHVGGGFCGPPVPIYYACPTYPGLTSTATFRPEDSSNCLSSSVASADSRFHASQHIPSASVGNEQQLVKPSSLPALRPLEFNDYDIKLNSAVRFLSHPAILNASRRAKKEFLMQKGFSEKEVETAFSRVPTSQVLTQSEANDPSAGRNVHWGLPAATVAAAATVLTPREDDEALVAPQSNTSSTECVERFLRRRRRAGKQKIHGCLSPEVTPLDVDYTVERHKPSALTQDTTVLLHRQIEELRNIAVLLKSIHEQTEAQKNSQYPATCQALDGCEQKDLTQQPTQQGQILKQSSSGICAHSNGEQAKYSSVSMLTDEAQLQSSLASQEEQAVAVALNNGVTRQLLGGSPALEADREITQHAAEQDAKVAVESFVAACRGCLGVAKSRRPIGTVLLMLRNLLAATSEAERRKYRRINATGPRFRERFEGVEDHVNGLLVAIGFRREGAIFVRKRCRWPLSIKCTTQNSLGDIPCPVCAANSLVQTFCADVTLVQICAEALELAFKDSRTEKQMQQNADIPSGASNYTSGTRKEAYNSTSGESSVVLSREEACGSANSEDTWPHEGLVSSTVPSSNNSDQDLEAIRLNCKEEQGGKCSKRWLKGLKHRSHLFKCSRRALSVPPAAYSVENVPQANANHKGIFIRRCNSDSGRSCALYSPWRNGDTQFASCSPSLSTDSESP